MSILLLGLYYKSYGKPLKSFKQRKEAIVKNELEGGEAGSGYIRGLGIVAISDSYCPKNHQ